MQESSAPSALTRPRGATTSGSHLAGVEKGSAHAHTHVTCLCSDESSKHIHVPPATVAIKRYSYKWAINTDHNNHPIVNTHSYNVNHLLVEMSSSSVLYFLNLRLMNESGALKWNQPLSDTHAYTLSGSRQYSVGRFLTHCPLCSFTMKPVGSSMK